MVSVRRLIQALLSGLYLVLVILAIPLAFDVGGEDCGIAFTFTLSAVYLVLSTVRIVSRNTKFSIAGMLFFYLQHIIIIPSMLILHLSLFSGVEEPSPLWVKVVTPWCLFVHHATPLFTILEGFCTLLVIQATGQITRWLNRRSDTWMFVQIIVAACTLTTSLYFLYRIYTFPVAIQLTSATLIGAALTMATFLGLYGIISGKGTPIESAQLFSYVVYGLYVTFTDFRSSITPSLFFPFLSPPPAGIHTAAAQGGGGLLSSLLNLGQSTTPTAVPTALRQTVAAHLNQAQVPPFPPVIITGYSNLVKTLAKLTPQGFTTVFEFFLGAMATITPSVAVSLAYRLFVFFAATRIIPALKSSPPGPSPATSPPISPVGSHLHLPNQSQGKLRPASPKRISKSQPLLFLVYSYAPCIIIAVYTHLLLQHSGIFGTTVSGGAVATAEEAVVTSWQDLVLNLLGGNSKMAWQFWGWVNIFTMLTLYGVELFYGTPVYLEEHFKKD